MIEKPLLSAAVVALTSVLLGGCRAEPEPRVATPEPTVHHMHTRPSDGMVVIYVPAGEFVMGSTGEDVDYALQLCNEAYGNC